MNQLQRGQVSIFQSINEPETWRHADGSEFGGHST